MEFKSILFPVDFSARSEAAAPYVKKLARLFDCSIHLLHVMEHPAYFVLEMPFIPETHWMEMRKRAGCALAEMAREDFEGVNVIPVIRQGDAATEITAFAEEHGTGLVAMPTHGCGRFRAALLGSVPAKVLNDLRCPVWTLAHSETGEVNPTIRSILCGVKLDPESRSLVRETAELGARTGAKVRLVHAIAGGEPGAQGGMDLGFQRFLKDSATASMARLQQETGTSFDVCMETGPPSRVIAEAARHHQGDLVVIGRVRLHEFAGQLRTDVYSIIRDSPCPVLSL
jgi:nucleotide-binding universal stress UspA family protein